MKARLSDQALKVLREIEVKRETEFYPIVGEEVGEFLYNLVKKEKPRKILEIGTCVGYSAIWLGSAASDIGSGVETFEFSTDRGPVAIENIKNSGLTNVTVHIENAKEGIKKLEGEFDLVFVDAMKQEYQEYFDLIEPKLSHRGIVVCDNILSHREALQGFVEYVKNKQNFKTELIPLGAGLLISYKKTT